MQTTRTLCLALICLPWLAHARPTPAQPQSSLEYAPAQTVSPQPVLSAPVSTATALANNTGTTGKTNLLVSNANQLALTNVQAALTLAVGEPRQTRVLAVADVIQLGLQHNLALQIQRYNPLVNQDTLNADYAAFEPLFSFTADQAYNSTPGSILPQNGGLLAATRTRTETFQPDFSGTLPEGMTYDLNAGPLNREKNNIPGFVNPTYTASPGITLSQPLLKNFWTDNSRFVIQLAKNTLKTSEEQLRLQIMQTTFNLKTAYYNLIYSRENVKVNVEALQLANEQLAEDRKREQVGTLAPLDVEQDLSQAATSRAAVLAAQQQLVAQEDLLKNLLTDNYSEWAQVTPIPSEELVALPETLDLQESWRRALAQRPEMIQQKLALDRQNITVRYDLNQLYPEVDLTGSYGQNALDNTFDNTVNDVGQAHNPFYSYGVVVKIPLGSIAERNNYKQAKALVKQALLQLKQQEQTIVVEIDNDVQTIRSDFQQVSATREARVYAEAALDAEKKKLENGTSTTFEVLQMQKNLTAARTSEIQALSLYNNAVEQWVLDEGSTLERNHIELSAR